jgi:hypothetical protein
LSVAVYPASSNDLKIEIPEVPQDWQFVSDVIPAQLAAEQRARLSGVDCDTFRVCSFIVEDEHGEAAMPGVQKERALLRRMRGTRE